MSEKLIEKCFVVSDPYRDKVSENRNREKELSFIIGMSIG